MCIRDRLFGHYVAWIAAGIMGAGSAVLLKSTIVELDPGDVAYQALGLSGFVIVIIAGWTTANANMYRAGLAAQAIFHNHSRKKVTFTVGCVTVVVACFPFVFGQMLPMLTYAGLLVVPVGAIVFAEHVIFPKIGFTRYWATYRKPNHSTPAVASWAAGLVFGFGLNAINVISFYYLFLPTWVFTILLYTFLARQCGAAKKYPAEEAADREMAAAIKSWQSEQDDQQSASPVKDNSALTKALQVGAWISLACIVILAVRVMFWSPDIVRYEANAATFKTWGFVFTITYFGAAYAALRRRSAVYAHAS